jgi:hypothetical protein
MTAKAKKRFAIFGGVALSAWLAILGARAQSPLNKRTNRVRGQAR